MKYIHRFFYLLLMALIPWASLQAKNFDKSYAIVVGIDSYLNAPWQKLNYAVKDARGMAEFLKSQGFEIEDLYNSDATRSAIVALIEDKIAPRLTDEDRVMFFFAGHGNTRRVAGQDWGYLVPVDATESTSSQLSMGRLRDLSLMMGVAKHQLFIVDACYGGLLSERGSTLDPQIPNYIDAVTDRKARQILTAGGADQRVADGGPKGHSLFTGELLNALKGGLGDTNGDGYITFLELSTYMQVAASRFSQTPGVGYLDGHQMGEFVFSLVQPKSPSTTTGKKNDADSKSRSPQVDVYELLAGGKQAFLNREYNNALELFGEAASRGNAEAMVFLARMYFDGLGVAKDWKKSLEWYNAAAKRKSIYAMRSLEAFYQYEGSYKNKSMSEYWRREADKAEQLERAIVLVNPQGKVGTLQPKILKKDVVLPTPTPPFNLKILIN